MFGPGDGDWLVVFRWDRNMLLVVLTGSGNMLGLNDDDEGCLDDDGMGLDDIGGGLVTVGVGSGRSLEGSSSSIMQSPPS